MEARIYTYDEQLRVCLLAWLLFVALYLLERAAGLPWAVMW